MISDNAVYWITGLAGAGKTTIGKIFNDYLKQKNHTTIILDGDEIRDVLQNEDYSPDGRKKLAFLYGRMAKWLYMQGVDVIVCTVSMYDDVRNANRSNIERYREIYLEIPKEELVCRDQKGMYSSALSGNEKNVCGVNICAELPKSPDIIIKNYGEITPEKAAQQIIDFYNL